jgi:hypothetical protein
MTEPTPTETVDAHATEQAGEKAQEAAAKTFTEEYVKELRSEAAKYRQEAKAAKTEADKARNASLTEAERAVAEAEQRGRTTALAEFGGRLVDAELRAAAAGRNVDVDALLEVVDRSRFLTDDGDVDRKALGAWVDRIAPAQPDTGPVIPSFDGGARTPHAPGSTAQQFAKALGSAFH